MTKRVTVEELREHLDDYVADLERGESLKLVLPDGKIAAINPGPSGLVFAHRPPPGVRLGDYKPRGLGRKADFDALEFYNADRDKERNR